MQMSLNETEANHSLPECGDFPDVDLMKVKCKHHIFIYLQFANLNYKTITVVELLSWRSSYARDSWFWNNCQCPESHCALPGVKIKHI